MRDKKQDILKGLAILMVVFSHMLRGMKDAGMISPDGWAGWVDFILYTTHMPVFFLVAGYNAYSSVTHHGGGNYLRGRFWALVYPYLFWSCMLWSLKVLTDLLVGVNHPVSLSNLLSIGWQPISPYWFLYALLLMQLLLILFRKRAEALLLVAVGMAAGVEIITPTLLPVLKTTALHLPFFALGVWLAFSQNPLIPAQMKHWRSILALILLFVTGAALLYQAGFRPVSGAGYIVSLAGVGLLMALSTRLCGSKMETLFVYLGKYSLPIFLMHVVFTAQARIVLGRLGVEDSFTVLMAGTLLGVCMPLAVNAVAEKKGVADYMGLTGKSPLRKPASN